MEGGGGGILCILSAMTVTSFASEGDEYDDVEEEEHSPSEVFNSPSEVDDEEEEGEELVGFQTGLGRFLSLANSEEEDIFCLKSRSLF